MSAQDRSRPKPKVFVPRAAPSIGISRLQQHCEVITYDNNDKDSFITFDDFKRNVMGIDAIFVFPPHPINKEILDAAGPQLKVVCSHSVGLDHIDLDECKKRGIKVGHTPNVLTNAVAEMTIALTLLTARRLEEALHAVHDGTWKTKCSQALWMVGKQISGSVIGFVGLGRIGFATAKRFKSFEPSRIVYCGHSPKSYASEIDADFLPFHELLNKSDFVIVTCSLNSSTKQLFNADAFKQMKGSSILVNVSRGDIVDQEALYNALTTHQIAAAGLDVTTPEPLPTDHKLMSLPNCAITPHIASATLETRNAMCELTVDNILAGLNDEPLPSPAY